MTFVKNTEYKLAKWKTPSGKYIMAELPEEIKGWHFGPGVRQEIIYQNQKLRVPQEKVCSALNDKGILISEGEINRILEDAAKKFAPEKDGLIEVGLRSANVIGTDDTGARHRGKNGYCTVINNEFFAAFKSTDTKSRINFFEMMRGKRTDYLINEDALTYIGQYKLNYLLLSLLKNHKGVRFIDNKALEGFFEEYAIKSKEQKRILTEGMLYAVLLESGISEKLKILSDGARQFDVFDHSKCWIHEERPLKKMIPADEQERQEIAKTRDLLWNFYQKLKDYKVQPSAEQKLLLSGEFDEIFTRVAPSQRLNEIHQGIFNDKAALLKVLEDPKIPLHNNDSERDLREYVIKRKISGGTRTQLGRELRDTFTSLSKTCTKNGISFWDFLSDRIHGHKRIPYLPDLIRQKAEMLAGP